MTALHIVVMLENVEQIILHSDSDFFMILILSSYEQFLQFVTKVLSSHDCEQIMHQSNT